MLQTFIIEWQVFSSSIDNLVQPQKQLPFSLSLQARNQIFKHMFRSILLLNYKLIYYSLIHNHLHLSHTIAQRNLLILLQFYTTHFILFMTNTQNPGELDAVTKLFKDNPNTIYGMDEPMLRTLANGNTQFVINLSRELELGYSVPALALHISHLFFAKMCYINYDRFLVLAASILIALKVKDISIPIKKLCNAFYKVISSLNKSIDPYNEKKFELVRDEICQVESLIYRVLEYSMDFKLPLQFVDKYTRELVPEKKRNKIFFTCRVLIIDSYRTFACLLYNPLVIFLSSLLIACRYENIKCFENSFVRGCQGVEANASEEELYHKMLQLVGKSQEISVKAEDVRDCIREMNRLFDMLLRYGNHH